MLYFYNCFGKTSRAPNFWLQQKIVIGIFNFQKDILVLFTSMVQKVFRRETCMFKPPHLVNEVS